MYRMHFSGVRAERNDKKLHFSFPLARAGLIN